MHTYSVEFRISSKGLDPNEVTRKLDLQPSQIRIAGQSRSEGKIWVESLWAYDGRLDSHAPATEWKSLEEGILFVLNKLVHKKDLIRTYTDSAESIWWCGHFQSTFDGGPTLSAPLIRELADFGAPIFIDNYFRTDP